jgi:hypothetical protein
MSKRLMLTISEKSHTVLAIVPSSRASLWTPLEAALPIIFSYLPGPQLDIY